MKVFRVLALLISTLILTFSISLASSIYPPYLNGDTNLKLIDGHMVRLPAAEKAFYQIYNLRFFDSFSNEFYWR